VLSQIFSSDPAALAHAPEDPPGIVKVEWSVKFRNLTLVHDYDPVVINDRFEAMRYCQKLANVAYFEQD
jgi:hypothetical protein